MELEVRAHEADRLETTTCTRDPSCLLVLGIRCITLCLSWASVTKYLER